MKLNEYGAIPETVTCTDFSLTLSVSAIVNFRLSVMSWIVSCGGAGRTMDTFGGTLSLPEVPVPVPVPVGVVGNFPCSPHTDTASTQPARAAARARRRGIELLVRVRTRR